MNRFLEFFQEDNGGFSATRLAFLLWVIGVLVVWIIESLSSKTLEHIDPTVTTILGILMTGKVVQKFGEKPNGAGDGAPAQTTGPAPAPRPNPAPVNPAQPSN
jgi:hypothetical protein